MNKKSRVLLIGFFLLLFMGALEIVYRINLYIKFPDNFKLSKADEKSSIVIFDKPQWKYDSRFGYSYPHVRLIATEIKNGLVIHCYIDTPANSQGNIGPNVLDFNRSKHRIVVFGDSFSANKVNDMTWPNMLSEKLNNARGDDVRVMNLARDGYGVLQMFDLAVVKIPELKPTLVVFAFNSTAIARGRSWRVKVGDGDEARMLSTTENSPNSNFANSVDMLTLIPGGSEEWCKAMLSKSADEQHKDPILKKALNKTLRIRQENEALLKANVWDLSSSYIYHLLIHRDPFFGQNNRMSSAANPIIAYDDFKNDPAFLKAVATVRALGVPFVLVHLPLGISVRDHQEFYLDEQGRSLKDSLEVVTGHKVISMRPYLSINDSQGMKLCESPNNCHPSLFGMQVYAESIAKVLAPLLRRDNH